MALQKGLGLQGIATSSDVTSVRDLVTSGVEIGVIVCSMLAKG